MRIILYFLFAFSFATLNYSQTSAGYFVDFHTFDGELTNSDQMKAGFGKYDGYELEMNKGEIVNFFVYTEDFTPKLVLVDPKGRTAKVTKVDKIYATMQLQIPISGDWIIYVVGTDSAVGKYYFQYALTDSASMYISESADFCSKIKYLTAHAKANFRLFEYNEYAMDNLPDLSGFGQSFLDLTTGSYNSVLYDGENIEEAEKIFNSYFSKTEKCLDEKNWKKKEEDWKETDTFRSKMKLLNEKGSEKRFIALLLTEYFEDQNYNHITLEFLIGREGQ